ncbi:guanine nucleotide-binding protein subunit beta-like protein 1 isoform X2 [Antennarius striatus]|uniref:guanine nucleotide-binding protein subunit beta-like protein 1 isoform X2 n=1 Tax=Antennarius striatus TaxID=241820 RepID=UPI0035AE45BE
MSCPSPAPIYTLRGASAPLNTLHFSCNGRDTPLLFSGSAKGAIHVWNLNTRRAHQIVEGHAGSSITWVSTLQEVNALISQGRDMQICLWDLSEGRTEVMDSVWTGSVGFCQSSLLKSSPGHCLLAFAGEQTEEVKVIELPSKTPVCSLVPDAKHGMVMCIKLWQPDSGPGPLLLAGYEDGSLLLWDVTQRSKLCQVKAHPEPVMCLAFDPKHLRGISGSSEKKLSSWILDRQNNLQFQDSVMLVNPGVSQLCIRGDSKLLASAGWDHRDPRQRLLAAGSKDQRISLWSIYSERADTG